MDHPWTGSITKVTLYGAGPRLPSGRSSLRVNYCLKFRHTPDWLGLHLNALHWFEVVLSIYFNHSSCSVRIKKQIRVLKKKGEEI